MQERRMPRYFFHVIDGVDVPDLEGTLLPGLAEARSQAIVTAGEILKSQGLRFWNGTEWRMKVTDDVGTSVLTLKFSADDHDTDR
jgi:hypothetical protein